MSNIYKILSDESGLSESDVRIIVSNAPFRYKTYNIPKRNGGLREISQPAKELKVLQRIIVDKFLANLPIHACATAYRSGFSILSNATPHAKSGAILKLDFSDFFPSITSNDWHLYCEDNNIFNKQEDVDITSNILFRRKSRGSILRLAIGAPSSPILSNILMFNFDDRIYREVQKHKVSYTRYADDVTFSARRAGNLSEIKKIFSNVVKETKSPKLKINEEKTVFSTKKYHREVTGLVISDSGFVSIGHQKKRKIRSEIHHCLNRKLSSEDMMSLAGKIAYINSVEPSFIRSMEEKYNISLIKKIYELINSS